MEVVFVWTNHRVMDKGGLCGGSLCGLITVMNEGGLCGGSLCGLITG